MLAIDTNVLVRLLVEDDPIQSRAAAAVVRTRSARGERVLVTRTVLVETVWVLKAAYGQSRAQIVDVLSALLRADDFVIDGSDAAGRALRAYADGRGDFADYIIREDALAAGATMVVTFDRVLQREDGFVRP
ncbi:MAG: type II toxin-antitoxin system VapC family toxin [Gemmatimonadaceae bacterium]|nr:type II toxin-antitoxin system VapC family toxin [Gemmatimonadaceae bacterium]